MSIFNTNTIVTLDETAGLQNAAALGDTTGNDIAASSLPTEFLNRLIALGAATPTMAALSGYTGAIGDTGTNVVTYTPIGGAMDMFFSGADGKVLNGTDSKLLTIDDKPIYLYTDSGNNNILLGKTSGGDIAFAAYLEQTSNGQTGAKIWMVQYGALFNPNAANPDDPVDLSGLVNVTINQDRTFSLENAPSGQNLFMMFGDSEIALVVTGMHPANQSEGFSINTGDTVNTSFAAGSTTIGVNNQMVNPGEGLYYTFVTGANTEYTVPNLSENEADVEANIDFTGLYKTNAAKFSIVQLQGDKAATVKITAKTTAFESGVNFIDGLDNDTQVNITSVLVHDSNGADVTGNLVIQNVGGIVTITGIQAGDVIDYHTDGDHNRLLVENAGTENGTAANFDVGGFRLTNSLTETVGVGGNMVFQDDGPSITLATPTDAVTLTTQDADTVAAAYDTDTQDFSGAFGIASQNYGADGANASGLTWGYALGVASQGINSDLTSHGDAVYLYLVASGKVVGSTASDEAGITVDNTIFDLSVSGSGSVTLTQYSAIDHGTPGAESDYASQLKTLGDNKVSLTGTATIKDFDLDTASDYKVLDLGGNIRFNDDGPSITLATPTDTVTLTTHDALTIGPAYDTDSKSFAEAFGIASSSYGADGVGASELNWSYALSIASQGIDSKLTTNSSTVRLFQLASGLVVGSTVSDLANVSTENIVFDLGVDSAGVVTLHQYGQINHPTPGSGSNYSSQTISLDNELISLKATAAIKDFDQDTASDYKVLDLGGNFVFSDDGPTVTSISNPSGPNLADPIYGTYDFGIGADIVNNDAATGIVLQTLSGATAFSATTPQGRAISNTSVAWVPDEDNSHVSFTFSFQYYAGPNSTTTHDASGIVTFNKTNGTYLFDINPALVGEKSYSTSTPLTSYNYDTMGNKMPEIVVQKYSNDFYGVLTGQASSPPSKTETLVSGSDLNYTSGEIFHNSTTSYMNVATDTVGVDSDTIQAGELLNYDFYKSNPVSGATSPPQRGDATVNTSTEKAFATGVDITLSQLNSDEDIVVLLKLWDPVAKTATTRLLVANDASDYQTVGAYKVVHITENNYDSAKYEIYGLQVLSSTEKIQGTGYELSNGNAVTLGSTGKGYQNTADLDVFKIIKIDLTTQTLTAYDADLNFAGQVIDHDTDYANFNFSVHLEADGLPPFTAVTTTGVAPTVDHGLL